MAIDSEPIEMGFLNGAVSMATQGESAHERLSQENEYEQLRELRDFGTRARVHLQPRSASASSAYSQPRSASASSGYLQPRSASASSGYLQPRSASASSGNLQPHLASANSGYSDSLIIHPQSHYDEYDYVIHESDYHQPSPEGFTNEAISMATEDEYAYARPQI